MQNPTSVGRGRPENLAKGESELPRAASWSGPSTSGASTSNSATYETVSTGNAVRAPVHNRKHVLDQTVDSLTSADCSCTNDCCYERGWYDLRREIEVRKAAGKPFGVKLQLFRREVYIVHVTTGSPAWHSGVQLFDKIDAIDSVSIPRNAEPSDVQKLLDQPASFCLKVIDSAAICSMHYINPNQTDSDTATHTSSTSTAQQLTNSTSASLLSTRVSLSFLPSALTSSPTPSPSPSSTMLGIVFLNGVVQSVHPRSAAARAHVPVNRSIVGVNGRLVHGWPDSKVLHALVKLLSMGLRIEITCMPTETANLLLGPKPALDPGPGLSPSPSFASALSPTPSDSV